MKVADYRAIPGENVIEIHVVGDKEHWDTTDIANLNRKYSEPKVYYSGVEFTLADFRTELWARVYPDAVDKISTILEELRGFARTYPGGKSDCITQDHVATAKQALWDFAARST